MSTRRRSVIAILLLSLTLASGAAGAHPVPSRAGAASQDGLAGLVEEYRELREAEHRLPVPDGTDPRYDARLSRVSVDRFEADGDELAGLLSRLRDLPEESLSSAELVDARILEHRLRSDLGEIEHRAYLLPLGSRSGFHFAFAGRPRDRLDSPEDYVDYVAALQSFQAHVRDQIELMRAGIEAGMVMPAAVMDGYEKTAGAHVVEEARDSDFWGPFQDMPSDVDDEEAARLRRDGAAAIRDSVIPGYRQLRDFFVAEYIPAARDTLGVTDLPDGEAFYAHRIRMHTTLPATAREIHDIGVAEVDRLREEMREVLERVGFEGSFAAFVEHLRTDPRFTVDTAEAYLEKVAWAAKRMDGRLPELFGTLPRTPYGVRAMPAHIAARQSAGYYDAGDPGSRGGMININTSFLDQRPTFVALPLAFHEGAPGHHLQIMLARENDAISEFRRRAGITAFTEGWGLYAERLGQEVGLYTDPYDDWGRLSYEIWRAVRLVVDTGMHALDWSRQRAIDYMAANTGMGLDTVAAEIDRHITEAGQGLAYKMGELKITELRRRAERTLGDDFDLRVFHDVVLGSGPVTLGILEENVEAWISAVQHDETP